MKYNNILITGGAGFIGSNLAVYFKREYPRLKVFVLDNLVRRGSEFNLPRLKENGVKFIRGDARRPKDLDLEFDIDLILECSAEPSVLAGYQNPSYIIDTNLMGTVNCLELCRKRKAGMIFLSTSRVYPYEKINAIKRLESKSRFEWPRFSGIDTDFSLTGPKTLYGATKLASEFILQEYIAAYGIKAVVNRCGVVAGPWQFGKVDQGVFTYWMLAHYFKKPLKYIGFGGQGKQVRDLLHVDDLCRLIGIQANSLPKLSGNTYNVGGAREISLSLLETTALCRQISGNNVKVGHNLRNRPGDIAVYLTDNKKVTRELKWQPQKPAITILNDIFNWIRNNEAKLRKL
ncbi:MAG: NAD-dependent epimerase/dehydratase family protein [Candidatus Omnitrophica bacterium]|nr:NAD-dependent epimerase/dehydratase family protein [Candidatus Omnitrophota bacterium]MDD5476662.1 NAD-dependent epimerase/dehydratase family protein [Candidatus Omnitrophota bacterium]